MNLDVDKYNTMCAQDKVKISSPTGQTLSLTGCNGRRVSFHLERSTSKLTNKTLPPRDFYFDFRYNEPYNGQGMTSSGLYVFKTEDQDSRPYDHGFVSAQAY
jgi:hypothetical protein